MSLVYIIFFDGLGNDWLMIYLVVICMICNVLVIVLLEISFVWCLLIMYGEIEE